MATTAQLDTAFRQAGISVGVPSTAKFERLGIVYIAPNSETVLADMFNDDLIKTLQSKAGESSLNIQTGAFYDDNAFTAKLAAEIVSYLAAAGITEYGRIVTEDQLAVNEGFDQTYIKPNEFMAYMTKRITLLKKKARAIDCLQPLDSSG